MKTTTIIKRANKAIKKESFRSAWGKGIQLYAIELLEKLEERAGEGVIQVNDLCNNSAIEKALLNGAHNWSEYSEGACSLIYNEDIAKRLCTATELKRTQNGLNPPCKNGSWLDLQARALRQAFWTLSDYVKMSYKYEEAKEFLNCR